MTPVNIMKAENCFLNNISGKRLLSFESISFINADVCIPLFNLITKTFHLVL